MPVLNSRISFQSSQTGGRKYIRETYVLDNGNEIHAEFMVADNWNETIEKDQRIASINLILRDTEISKNFTAFLADEELTFSHSTVGQFRTYARMRYIDARGFDAVVLGAAISRLTDIQLASMFNLSRPSVEFTALRTRVDRQAQRKIDYLAEAGQ